MTALLDIKMPGFIISRQLRSVGANEFQLFLSLAWKSFIIYEQYQFVRVYHDQLTITLYGI